mmetsp:Transcript_6768/g.8769  ORF Transcript_6768/g.8769 Transcript_6768/m.8769 type:complete len:287 (+) Transcript_6768:116-976(+)|eukprot:CAMPEP_0198136846 /NCGR_PEP_ID=MMETSP1443-20131203/420_1 /TAXON_ID=186043 /ORGANISM="Entomoneis sp., Strain CCMP2396" /LENGTH=286 /DNA_ID=CAMNT_0043798125 /DNA_START=80 /DNA_END=940 /DNA_ORIENTATION=-
MILPLKRSVFSLSVWLFLLLLTALSKVSADCVCECGSIVEEVCEQDACDFICKAAGDYGGDCGKGTIENCGDDDCIGAETVLFSCTLNALVPAHQVSIGDEIRTRLDDKNGSTTVCSQVYYTFHHESGKSNQLVQVQVEGAAGDMNRSDSTIITVTKNHLLYVSAENSLSSNKEYVSVLAKTVKVGDLLLASDGSFRRVANVKLETTAKTSLVNILTMNGSLEVENSIVISAHSFHEFLYAAVFYPLKIVFFFFGASMVQSAQPTLREFEQALKPSFAKVSSLLRT